MNPFSPLAPLDLPDFHDTHPLDQNSDFSALFAGSVNWDELQNSWIESLSSAFEPLGDFSPPTGTPGDGSAVASPSPAAAVAVTAAPDQAQLEIYRQIDEVDDKITQYELDHTGSADDEELLELKLSKAQLRIRLQELRNAPKDRALLSLQLEEVQLQLRLRKMRCIAANGSTDDLEDDREYVRLNMRRLELRDELAQIPKTGQSPSEADDQQTRPSPGRRDLSQPASGSSSPGPPFINDGIAPASPASTSSTPGPSAAEAKSKKNDATMSTTKKRSFVSGIPKHMQPVYRLFSSASPNKKSKLSDEGKQNKKEVAEKGGSCVNCKLDHSKCSGGEICNRCEREGLECVRPTLMDKNVFSHGIKLPDRPMSFAMSMEIDRRALVAAMVKDFFDMTDISAFRDQPDVLALVDAIYPEIMKFGFVKEVCEARCRALNGPCAFNVFVKCNAVLNNWHLKDAHRILEDRLRPDAELEVIQKSSRRGEELSVEAVHQMVAKQVAKRKTDTFKNIEILRALSSEYVFLVLQEILREGNIRECRDDSKTSKRVSLLAITALTLEQVLDLVDNSSRLSTWDERSASLSRHMALVLLSYVRPPSSLSFPRASALNRCFGKRPESAAGIFMSNEFWYELYKASAHAIPAHLLQIAEGAEDQRLAQQPLGRADLEAQVNTISNKYLAMNLGFDRRRTVEQTIMPGNRVNAARENRRVARSTPVYDTYATTTYRTTTVATTTPTTSELPFDTTVPPLTNEEMFPTNTYAGLQQEHLPGDMSDGLDEDLDVHV